MQTLRLSTGAAALAVGSLAFFGMAAPASGQASPTPPGQGGAYPPGQDPTFNCPNPAENRPPGRCDRGVSDNSVRPGQQMRASSGPAFDANSPGENGVRSTYKKLGDFRTNGAGEANVVFTVPKLAPGQHAVVFKGTKNGSPLEVSIPFTVEGTAANAAPGRSGGTPSSLPFTGADDLVPLTAAGIGLVLVGTGVVVASRRRRTDMDTAGVA